MNSDTSIDTVLKLNKQNAREKIFKILNLSVPILMGTFIFFTPFPHTTAIKKICFYLSVFIVPILIFFKKTEKMILPKTGEFALWRHLSVLSYKGCLPMACSAPRQLFYPNRAKTRLGVCGQLSVVSGFTGS